MTVVTVVTMMTMMTTMTIMTNATIMIKLGTQGSLGTGHLAFLSLDTSGSHLDGHRESLERTLGPVVVVVTSKAIHMKGEASGLRKALQAVRHHLGAQLAKPFTLEPELDDAIRTVGQVDDGPGERLVKRSVGVAEPSDSGEAAQGLVEGVAEGDAAVFGGVMVVDVEISLAAEGEAPTGVLGQGVEHVVEEPDAGVYRDALRLAGLRGVRGGGLEEARVGGGGKVSAVEVDGQLDLGLVGVAGKGCGSDSEIGRAHV